MTTDNTAKIAALANFLECDVDEIEECKYDSDMFEYGREEWLVLDDDEADNRADMCLDSYIDECIMPELPGQDFGGFLKFDREGWKEWAIEVDGRGHIISGYDGGENEIDDDDTGEMFFAYRLN